jgi:PKD domain-containing protein
MRPKRNGCGMWRLLRVLMLVGAISCRTKGLEPLALDISVTANKTTVATGEAVSFVVTAQGGGLVAVNMNYGDNTFEQFSTGGARTARITFTHGYSAGGTYQVRATVTDVEAGEKSTTMDIVVH